MKINRNIIKDSTLIILGILIGVGIMTYIAHRQQSPVQTGKVMTTFSNTQPSATNPPVDLALQNKIKGLKTDQFLELVASSSTTEQVKLYQAHSELGYTAGTVLMDHLVGNDFVMAAQSSIPYLMNIDNWDPLAAGDILVWEILKSKAATMVNPALWKLACGQPNCQALTEDQIVAKLKADPYQYTTQEIHGVLAELAVDNQGK